MSTDLHELFAETGIHAPTTSVDTDAAVHQGRRLRARRHTATGGAVLGVGAALAASAVFLSGLGAPATGSAPVGAAGGGELSTAPTAEPTSGPGTEAPAPSASASAEPSSVVVNLDPGELSAAARARLMAVLLPDPAPGFPVRRWDDPRKASPEGFGGSGGYWTRVWGLAETPYRQETSSTGQVSDIPTGPEVTLTVGYFPMPAHGKGIGIYDGERFVQDVDVAGARGWVTTAKDKGTAVRNLYVQVGDLSVWIDGMGGVSTQQLVALGNALRGLS